MEFIIIIVVIISIVSRISRQKANEEAARKARAAGQERSTVSGRTQAPVQTRPPAARPIATAAKPRSGNEAGPFNPWFTDSTERKPTPQRARPAAAQSSAEAQKRKREEAAARMRGTVSQRGGRVEQTGSLPPSTEGFGGGSEGRIGSEGSRLTHTLTENTKGRNATLQEGEGFEQSFSGSLGGTTRTASIQTRAAYTPAAAALQSQSAHQTAMDAVYGLREPQDRRNKLVQGIILREILDRPLALRKRA